MGWLLPSQRVPTACTPPAPPTLQAAVGAAGEGYEAGQRQAGPSLEAAQRAAVDTAQAAVDTMGALRGLSWELD